MTILARLQICVSNGISLIIHSYIYNIFINIGKVQICISVMMKSTSLPSCCADYLYQYDVSFPRGYFRIKINTYSLPKYAQSLWFRVLNDNLIILLTARGLSMQGTSEFFFQALGDEAHN